MTFVFLFVDIVIILIWSVVDPLRKEEKFLTNEVLYTSNFYDWIYEGVYEKGKVLSQLVGGL